MAPLEASAGAAVEKKKKSPRNLAETPVAEVLDTPLEPANGSMEVAMREAEAPKETKENKELQKGDTFTRLEADGTKAEWKVDQVTENGLHFVTKALENKHAIIPKAELQLEREISEDAKKFEKYWTPLFSLMSEGRSADQAAFLESHKGRILELAAIKAKLSQVEGAGAEHQNVSRAMSEYTGEVVDYGKLMDVLNGVAVDFFEREGDEKQDEALKEKAKLASLFNYHGLEFLGTNATANDSLQNRFDVLSENIGDETVERLVHNEIDPEKYVSAQESLEAMKARISQDIEAVLSALEDENISTGDIRALFDQYKEDLAVYNIVSGREALEAMPNAPEEWKKFLGLTTTAPESARVKAAKTRRARAVADLEDAGKPELAEYPADKKPATYKPDVADRTTLDIPPITVENEKTETSDEGKMQILENREVASADAGFNQKENAPAPENLPIGEEETKDLRTDYNVTKAQKDAFEKATPVAPPRVRTPRPAPAPKPKRGFFRSIADAFNYFFGG